MVCQTAKDGSCWTALPLPVVEIHFLATEGVAVLFRDERREPVLDGGLPPHQHGGRLKVGQAFWFTRK